MGPCIYNIMRDSIGRGEKTRMAAVSLLYAGHTVHIIQVGDTEPQRGSTKESQKHKGSAPQKKRAKGPTVLCTGLLYSLIYM
jgi:hypothetical protein